MLDFCVHYLKYLNHAPSNQSNRVHSNQSSHFNIFVSHKGKLSFSTRTENIQMIQGHVNHEIIDRTILATSRECSKPIEDKLNQDIYRACLRYNAGDCWFNGPLSRNEDKKLTQQDNLDINNIIRGLTVVKALPFNNLNLFHGFEFHLKYNDSDWKIGSTYQFSYFLSKTPSWKVASFFASHPNSKLYQKYLVCKYPEPGSKHICLDVRMPYNDEYEYLSFGESFRFIETVYHLGINFWYFLPIPVIRVYYVMEYVGCNLERNK
jgi:hypothetical protein